MLFAQLFTSTTVSKLLPPRHLFFTTTVCCAHSTIPIAISRQVLYMCYQPLATRNTSSYPNMLGLAALHSRLCHFPRMPMTVLYSASEGYPFERARHQLATNQICTKPGYES
ncbi:hypothetical protein EI94DRAFT_1721183 [Lactarius quietus]|nr:hypothetical protein EI94DRAFT_1721183 [Lactarius quietus]